jgi:phage/plasmid-associated DNA primase
LSKTEKEILESARIIQGSSIPIIDDERLPKLITVILAGKIQKKEVTPGAIKKVINRMETPPTEEELIKVTEDANTAYTLLKIHKKDELIELKKKSGLLPGTKYPDNLYSRSISEDGEETITGLNHPEICKYIINKLHTVSFNDTLFVYTPDGVYREDMHDVSAIVIDILHDKNLQQGETTSCNNIILGLKGMNTFIEYPFDAPGNIILISNGALKIDPNNVTLLPHSHEHMKTLKLPATYKKEIKPCAVMKVFHSWVDEDDVPILTQIIAQGIYQNMRRTTFKRNYLLQGPPDAGKSTYMDLCIKFIDKKLKCDISLQQICKNERFLAANFEGMLFNMHDDLKDIPLDGSGNFNKFTGTCDHGIERKGKDAYQGFITCPHVFTCNKPPAYDETLQGDEAWWKRWDFLSFPNLFIRDAGYQDRVFTEDFLSGLLNLVIAEIQYILSVNALRITHDPTIVQERWGMLSDPLKMWVSEKFDWGSEFSYFDKRKMHNKYLEYMAEQNVPLRKQLISEEWFGRKLTGNEEFVNIQAPKHLKKLSTSGYVYKSKLMWIGGPSSEVTIIDEKKQMSSGNTDLSQTLKQYAK